MKIQKHELRKLTDCVMVTDVYVVIMILWSMMFFYLTKFMKNSEKILKIMKNYVIINCNCYDMYLSFVRCL